MLCGERGGDDDAAAALAGARDAIAQRARLAAGNFAAAFLERVRCQDDVIGLRYAGTPELDIGGMRRRQPQRFAAAVRRPHDHPPGTRLAAGQSRLARQDGELQAPRVSTTRRSERVIGASHAASAVESLTSRARTIAASRSTAAAPLATRSSGCSRRL
jgi:hypothetical protein